MNSFQRVIWAAVFLACGSAGLLTSPAAQAQDSNTADNGNPGVVENVIRQFQKNLAPSSNSAAPDQSGNNARPQNQSGDAGVTPPIPQGIPGIATAGDNAALPAIPEVSPTWEERPTVILRALDKVTARTQTFEIPVGRQFNFGALTIVVRACRARPPLEAADAAAFLQIVEQKPGEPLVPRFSGWMFSSSPSLSALEHPVYDVWIVGCGSAAKS